jgi:hypothetical protein
MASALRDCERGGSPSRDCGRCWLVGIPSRDCGRELVPFLASSLLTECFCLTASASSFTVFTALWGREVRARSLSRSSFAAADGGRLAGPVSAASPVSPDGAEGCTTLCSRLWESIEARESSAAFAFRFRSVDFTKGSRTCDRCSSCRSGKNLRQSLSFRPRDKAKVRPQIPRGSGGWALRAGKQRKGTWAHHLELFHSSFQSGAP